jgi:hypothetical protein
MLTIFSPTGMSVKIATIPIMTSEIVPAAVRGAMVMTFQLWVAFGILVYVSKLPYFMMLYKN